MIYLLEDDHNIRNFVTYALNNSALETEGFATPSQFWEAIARQTPSLILLDIMLPEEDGLTILGKLRKDLRTRTVPIIMLTAKSTEYDKVIGLDGGADDYVTKPFGTMELIARVRALLRRATPQDDDGVYEIGDFYLCPAAHIVRVKGKNVSLTLKEFELLSYLCRHQGHVMSRDQILQDVWGYAFDGENRTVDVHVRTLRAKLDPCGDLIETVRGVGYKIGG